MFIDVRKEEILRPDGEIDVLIGFVYAGYHPVREQSSGNLLEMCNRFGKCLGGFHRSLNEGTRKLVQHVTIHHIRQIKVDDFYNIILNQWELIVIPNAVDVNAVTVHWGVKAIH